MILHSTIKYIFFALLAVLSLNLFAQTADDKKLTTKNSDTLTDSKQRYIAYSIGYHNPIPSGNNFIGKGLDGAGGFDFKIQLYIYKQFFIGGALGSSYFNVKDARVLGDYKRTRVAQQFLYFGYEFVPTENFRIGLNASIIGNSRYKNIKSNSAYQKDSARLNSYGFYLSFEFTNQVMIYVDYAYRIDKTNINVPLALENTFRRGTYNQIGIGLKFSFKGKDLISSF